MEEVPQPGEADQVENQDEDAVNDEEQGHGEPVVEVLHHQTREGMSRP
jgi:hypothetical protein